MKRYNEYIEIVDSIILYDRNELLCISKDKRVFIFNEDDFDNMTVISNIDENSDFIFTINEIVFNSKDNDIQYTLLHLYDSAMH